MELIERHRCTGSQNQAPKCSAKYIPEEVAPREGSCDNLVRFRDRTSTGPMQMTSLLLIHTLRRLRRSPGFVVAAVLTLGIGIGGTTGMFSVLQAALLRPLPFPDSDRVVVLTNNLEGANVHGSSEVGVSPPDIQSYSRQTHAFLAMGAYQAITYEVSGIGEPFRTHGTRLAAGAFTTLGVSPLFGRLFTQEEDDQAQRVVVVGYPFWRNHLHGDAHILGSEILLDRIPYSVVGVMPKSFEFPLLPGLLNRSELWVPLSLTQAELNGSEAAGNWTFEMIARLKPGVTSAQAQEDAEPVAREIMRTYPAFMASSHIRPVVRSLKGQTVAQGRPLVLVLFCAMAAVLLIGCANMGGLLLVRATQRRHEFAVRLALGAPALTLVSEAMLEGLILSGIAGLFGLGFAVIALRILSTQLSRTLPRIQEVALSWDVITFACILAVATGLLCEIVPAFAALRTSMNAMLRESSSRRATGSVSLVGLRSILVVAQIAAALVLLTASGLLLESFAKMRAVKVGFDPGHVVIASYSLPPRQYASQQAADRFNSELLRRIGQVPGTRFSGITSLPPMSEVPNLMIFNADACVLPREDLNAADVAVVSGDYFLSMGIPLARGRLFTAADQSDRQLVVIVNRRLAEHCWPGESPIGKRLRFGTAESTNPWLTVVGEVSDVKQGSPDSDVPHQFYLPTQQFEAASGFPVVAYLGPMSYLTVRSALPLSQVEGTFRSALRSLDPQLAVSEFQAMEDVVSATTVPRIFNTVAITGFAVAALLLGVVGIYGVISFSAVLRTQEIAVRMALGAQRVEIVRLLLGSALRLAAAGCCIGLLGAVAASRLLSALLFQVKPLDATVLILACAVIVLLSLAASWLPAHRAASVDPMLALRAE